MKEHGYEPTEIVQVLRTTSTVRKGVAGSKASPFFRVQESFSDTDGELVFWAFDDGDDATWEGIVYVENY